jgi:hypothetical protein
MLVAQRAHTVVGEDRLTKNVNDLGGTEDRPSFTVPRVEVRALTLQQLEGLGSLFTGCLRMAV